MSWWPTVPAWVFGDPGHLVRPSTKLAEMMSPTVQPTRHVQWQGRGSLGAWRRSPSLGAAAGSPVFYNATGNAISSAVCGSVYGFTVPGYEGTSVYIIQTKNGNPQYSGEFPVPMPPYTGLCNQDEGMYHLAAYDASTGQALGSVDFQVLPAGGQPSAAGPAVPTVTVTTGTGTGPGTTGSGGPPAPIHATGSLNLNSTTILALGVAAYLLFAGRRGG